MNKNEWGIKFVFSTGFNLSGFSTLSIAFTKPDGTVLVKSNPDVTAPALNIDTTEGLFPSHTYAQYVFQNGDVDQSGTWSARVTYTDAGQQLISDAATFTVGA